MFGGNSSVSAIKYYKKLGVYKASNVYFDPKAMHATSYNWWIFVKKIDGLVVFNDFNYSPTTTGHQRKIKAVLNALGVKVDLFVQLRESLDVNSLDSALKQAYSKLFTNEIAVNRKNARIKSSTHKHALANIDRAKDEIKTLIKHGAKCSKAAQAQILVKAKQAELARLESARAKRTTKAGTKLSSNDSFAKKALSFELVV